jgi:RHS repeat-associated protein
MRGLAFVLLLLGPAVAEAVQPLTALDPVEVYADGFQDLRGIAVDAAGNVFVADRAAGTVTRIAPDRTKTLVASGLERPIGLAVDLAGRLLIAEEKAARVVRVEPSGPRTPLVTGVKQPRWLAVREDGTLYLSARRLTRGIDPEPDDESAEPEVLLALSPAGALTVFADGFRHLQGLAVNATTLYAATRGRQSESQADGVVYRLPILADGSAGAITTLWPRDAFKKPVGLARDRLGALWLTTKELDLQEDEAKRAVAKLHPTGAVSLFAENLAKPQGLAFDATGHLYVADGTSGRVLRFLAPAPPTLTSALVTNQSLFAVTGTTAPGARVDVFVNDAPTPVTVTADATGAFSASVALTPNSVNTLGVFATTHGGQGLTSPATEATVTHDDQAPALVFQAPPAGAYVRGLAVVQVQATDSGSEVASLALTVDGQTLTATVTPAPPTASAAATASWDTTTVADGSHTLGATAIDAAGNPATATRVVLVDNTPPDTMLTSAPTGDVAVPDLTLGFTGADNVTPVANLLFAWRLDGGAWSAFSSSTSASFTGLTEGVHTFEVKARDLAGNEDPTPASAPFTVRFGPTITSVSPISGPIGTFVTLTGTNFEPGATSVTFTGLAAVVRTISATTLTTTVPLGATTGPLTVTTSRGSASVTFTVTTTGDFTLTAAPAPPAAARVIAGDQTSVSLAAGGSGSFTSLVSLGLSALPPGITASFSPSQFVAPGASAFVTLAVANTVAPRSYDLTVSGEAQVDGRPVTRTAAFTLDVLAPDTPAITGRVLTAEAVPQPIPGVTVTLGSAFTLTDAAGNFVLRAPPAGANMLLVDGRTASTPTAQYPPVEVQIDVAASGPTRVPYVLYLPVLDTAHPVTLPLDAGGFTTQEVKASTPVIPGLVVTIPTGTKIIGPDFLPVSQITITPVPVDRSPMPFPAGLEPPYLFTIQPGGAVPSQPLPITFPNVRQAAPGARADLWFFDLSAGTWQTWGTGTVSADGTQIVSDPGFGLPRFAWHTVCDEFCWGPPDENPPPELQPRRTAADPVDLFTGRFVVTKTDLVLPGRLALRIERTYWSGLSRVGLLGIGWNLGVYDTRLAALGTSLVLLQPDQSRLVFAPDGPDRWVNQNAPALRGAVLTRLPGEFNFQLRLRDGTVQRFERILGFANVAELTALTDRAGNTVTITREGSSPTSFGRITRLTEPAGRVLTLAYDGANRITAVTDPLGRTVQYTYDAPGRLETVTDAAGGVTRYAYDAQHRIVSITDPRGITYLTNEYDAQGRVSRQTQADGGVWQFSYTLEGRLVTQTVVADPRGSPTTHRFDSQGLALSTTDALGQTTVNEYAPGSNLLIATTDPLGRTTRFGYDTQGNVTTVTDPAGHTRAFTYEPAFNTLASITDPLGQVTSFGYDAQGNLTSITNPLGKVTTLAYNAFGQPITTTDPLGNTTTFTYDGQGNLTATADPLGNTSTFQYDAVSRPLRQLDPRGRATAFAYDSLNRITQITDALAGLTGFAYDPNGNLLTVTDARGNAITHTYSLMDRLTTRTDPLGASESFAYDLAGNLAQRTDRKGQVSTFTYDALNRQTAASYADGSGTSFTYDGGGRLVRMDDSTGGTLTNSYDGLDRLLAQSTTLGTVGYQYDALGRRTQLTMPGTAPTTYTYDAASRLTQIVHGAQIVDLQYDDAGRRTRLTLPNGVSTEYQYDLATRLTALIYRNAAGPLGDLTYRYDAAGNRVAIGGSFARSGLPAAVPTATYDAANRQLAFGAATMTYDANGNLAMLTDPSGETTYTWDARDQLAGVQAPGTQAAFAYAFGRRLAKTVNGIETRYFSGGLDVAQQMDAQGTTAFLRSLAIDELLALAGPQGTFAPVADALGSPLALTDASGARVTEYTYQPFGASSMTNPAIANPFQFTGREAEGATGLYYYRARYYHAGLHRFLSEDPIGLRGGDVNFYAYVRNSPTRFVDPSGLYRVEYTRASADCMRLGGRKDDCSAPTGPPPPMLACVTGCAGILGGVTTASGAEGSGGRSGSPSMDAVLVRNLIGASDAIVSQGSRSRQDRSIRLDSPVGDDRHEG